MPPLRKSLRETGKPRLVKGIRATRDIEARELDELFRQATIAAARHHVKKGTPITGLDREGRIVTVLDGNKQRKKASKKKALNQAT